MATKDVDWILDEVNRRVGRGDLEGARALLGSVSQADLCLLAKARQPLDLHAVFRTIDLSTVAGEVIFDVALQRTPILFDPLLQNPTMSAEQWTVAFAKFLHDYRGRGVGEFNYFRQHLCDMVTRKPELFEVLPDDFGEGELKLLLSIDERLMGYEGFMKEVARRLDFDQMLRCFAPYHLLPYHWAWKISGTEKAELFVQHMATTMNAGGLVRRLLVLFEANQEFCQVITNKTLASLMSQAQTSDERQRWIRVLARHQHADQVSQHGR